MEYLFLAGIVGQTLSPLALTLALFALTRVLWKLPEKWSRDRWED